jgi:hypothetical protein
MFVPNNEDYLVDLTRRREKFADRLQSNLRSFLEWVAVGAATDRRKGYRLDSVFHRNLQRISVAICQGLRLTMCPATPDRSYGVDDEPSGQTITTSDFRFAGFTAAKRTAFREQFRSSGAMNRSIHSSAAEKRRVRRVHNGIHLELRDIAAGDVDLAMRIFLQKWFVLIMMKHE